MRATVARDQAPSNKRSDDSLSELSIATRRRKHLGRMQFRVFQQNRPKAVKRKVAKRPFAAVNVLVQPRGGSAARCNRLSGVIVPLAPEYNMGGFLRRNELKALVSQSAHVNPLEQSLSSAQQDR